MYILIKQYIYKNSIILSSTGTKIQQFTCNDKG